MKSEYDMDSAVTFLLVGLGIGSILALVFSPRPSVAPDGIRGIDSWRAAGLRPREQEGAKAEEARERIA
jgi:hypothetical protein